MGDSEKALESGLAGLLAPLGLRLGSEELPEGVLEGNGLALAFVRLLFRLGLLRLRHGAEGSEVTEEMIRAGYRPFYAHDPDFGDPGDTLVKIYQAMSARRRRGLSAGCPSS